LRAFDLEFAGDGASVVSEKPLKIDRLVEIEWRTMQIASGVVKPVSKQRPAAPAPMTA
jgi:hypothetical protein